MMCDTCPTLAARCEELTEELRQVKEFVYARTYEAPREFNLTPLEERVLGVLLRHDRTVPRPVLFASSRDVPQTLAITEGEKLIQCIVCKVRGKIKPFGLSIETVWGIGYRLTNETRTRLQHWPSSQSEAA
jgi:two-component system, cell cycle response regulator CtrA